MDNKTIAMIWGAGGQDGYYLSSILAQKNIAVLPYSRSGSKLKGDVSDFDFVESQVKHHKPAFIFHLAANSTTQHEALFDNHSAISTGTLNILESVKRHSPETVVFLSGSAMQLKNQGVPIDETAEFVASSPYSVARIQSVYAGRYYRDTFGLKVFVGYFFNHDSPLRTEKHVNQKIVRAVQRIMSGSTEKLEIGNINVRKEFNFAGDMMQAIWTLVNQQNVFEAVIGSGEAHSIGEWTEYCFKKAGLNWHEYVVIKDFYIPEYEVLVSKPDLIKSLGWSPGTSFFQLADLMMDN